MNSATVDGRGDAPVGERYRRRALLRMVALSGALCATVLAVLALLTGCASLIGTHDIDISESQLTLLLARQFPMERKVMEVIDLDITNPQITLIPQGNRVGTDKTLRCLSNGLRATPLLQAGQRESSG